MPWLTNGDESLPTLPDGEPADIVRVNGVDVAVAEIPIDIFDRSNLGYYIEDEGQSELPNIVSGWGYENDNALYLPDDNPNSASNLAPSNLSYDSSEQIDLENYLRTGDIAEVYMRPSTVGSNFQFRWALFTDDYYTDNQNSIRLRFTDGYFRLEQGSDVYDDGNSESFTGFNDNSNYHRVVLDCSDSPTIECHSWDAETGEFIDTVWGNGDGDPSSAGHYAWVNTYSEMLISGYRKIDEDDFTAGEDL